MQRVMVIGQPGSGKSTLARELGAVTGLPVVHIDLIHWLPGWIERPRDEKSRLCAEVHARDAWIFEGGHSTTWPERLARCDTLVWLDLPYPARMLRVLNRTYRHYGQSRPDLPENCPEQISPEFWRWIWDTRHSGRVACQRLFDRAPGDKVTVRLTSGRAARAWIGAQGQAQRPRFTLPKYPTGRSGGV